MKKAKPNKLLKVVRDPSGPFNKRVHRDRTRYNRKMKYKSMNNQTTDKEIAEYIAGGGKYTYCEPQKVTRKMRIRNLGRKSAVTSRKGRENKMGLVPKLATLFHPDTEYVQALPGK